MADLTPFTTGDIRAAARRIVALADPHEKAARALEAARAWRDGSLSIEFASAPPDLPPLRDLPGRLDRPELRDPARMPKRRASGVQGRIALLHALAHIELNAINLAWDMVGRFCEAVGERAFIDDWVKVGEDEATHFRMLAQRIGELGAAYGDLPAHDGLWEAARSTAEDVLARLAVVPLVLEARGLDVCPAMIEKLDKAQDTQSASLLRIIYRDEVTHVAVGVRWLDVMCTRAGIDMRETWQDLVRAHFRGPLKPPFNEAARSEAGLPPDYYIPLSGHPGDGVPGNPKNP